MLMYMRVETFIILSTKLVISRKTDVSIHALACEKNRERKHAPGDEITDIKFDGCVKE